MHGIVKGMFVFMLFVVVVSYILYKSDVTIVSAKKDAYVSLIRAASQVATKEILDLSDVNWVYDGDRREAQDIKVNMDALVTFNRTLDRLMTTQAETRLKDVSKLNIVMTGFITYNFIVGVVYEGGVYVGDDNVLVGSYLLPVDYSMYMSSSSLPSELDNKLWKFTLGNRVNIGGVDYLFDNKSVRNMATDVYTDISLFLASISFPTCKSLSEFIVMSRIDEYLNKYSGTAFNKVAANLGASLEIDLGKTNASENRLDFTSKSSVISGPGMFAIVDIYVGGTGSESLYERTVSFGGSELVYRER